MQGSIPKSLTMLLIAVLMLALGSFTSLGKATPIAEAAPGDLLRTINVTPAPVCSITVGIEFVIYQPSDDSELLVTCWSDNVLTRVDEVTGTNLGTIVVSGIPASEGIGAISFDAATNTLWIGTAQVSPQKVYSAPLNDAVRTAGTTAATFRFFHTFGGFPIIDGLAFDGTDNTIWLSPDVNTTVYHYSQAGILLGSFSVAGKLGGFGNSGIAVASATHLYLANNGGAEIYRSDKTGTVVTLFADLGNKRVEDLSCDNRSFAPKSALWSKDAFDYELNAFEVTAGECAQGGVVEPDPEADLAVSKTCDTEVPAGANIECEVTVTNLGPDAATDVVLEDFVAGGTIVSATPSDGICDPPVANTVECHLDTLPATPDPDSSWTVVIVIDPASTTAGDVVTDEACAHSDALDDRPVNDCAVATTLIVVGRPATLTLDPKTATNTVGTKHCVTATVENAFGIPTPGITVRFKVTGSVNTTGSDVTDANGEAEFCYAGPALPGADSITAYADTDNDNTPDPGEPSDTATKTWVLPASTEGCKVTYGGRITAANGDKATFGGNAQAPNKGQEQYQDHGPATNINVHSINVLAIVCSPDRTNASIFGKATVNGAGSFDYRIDLKDLGEPGRTDTYRIRLSNGYDSGEQTLEKGGNVQIHK